jgi:RHS repeat-associated protein
MRKLRRGCVLMVMALGASLLPATAGHAGDVAGPGRGDVAGAFEPRTVNTKPTGGTPGKAERSDRRRATGHRPGLGPVRAIGGRPEVAKRRVGEVVQERTASSVTFLRDDGDLERVVFAEPVHFRSADGTWTPIDPALVAGGGGWRNAAARHQLSLPRRLQDGPVRVADGQDFVEFGLRGAAAAGSVEGAAATYSDALSGVDVVYTSTPEGVKEDLVVHSVEAGNEFVFDVATSDGLQLREADGGVAVVDADGETVFVFAAPFMHDASGTPEGRSTAVTLTVEELDGAAVLRLAADEAWLADDGRVWPVTIDPTLVLQPSSGFDTDIGSGVPDANFSTWEEMWVGSSWSGEWRSLIRMPVHESFDEPVTVLNAEIELYVENEAPGIRAHRLTRSWDHSTVTWNDAAAATAWDTPGGDYHEPQEWTTAGWFGQGSWRWFYLTEATQSWLDDPDTNHGVVVKAHPPSEPVGYFYTSRHADTTLRPRLSVVYRPLQGRKAHWRSEEFDLGGGRQAAVNVAGGNLNLAETDLRIAGTGLDFAFTRAFNSRAGYVADMGVGWDAWPTEASTRLYEMDNSDIALWPDAITMFYYRDDTSSPTWRPSSGANATLSDVGGADRQIAFHRSGERYDYTWERLTSYQDRNGNTITLGYDGSGRVVSVTDTQDRVTTLGYNASGFVETVTDPAGRVHSYGYSGSNLTSYTDPANNTTTYTYAAGEVKVTDPEGNATRFTLDSRSRVTAVTRVTNPSTGAGLTTTFDYSVPWRTTVTNARGNATVYHFDRAGRTTKVVDPLGRVRDSTWSPNSDPASWSIPSGPVTLATHDADNNVTSVTQPVGSGVNLTWGFDYDDGNHPHQPTRTTNPQGNAVTYGYDAKGNMNCLGDEAAGVAPCSNTGTHVADQVHISYLSNGLVGVVTDRKGTQTSYNYNSIGKRVTSMVINHPAPLGPETIYFDVLGRVESRTDGRGMRTWFYYDVMDRPVHIAYHNGPSVSFAYDKVGNRTTMTDATGTTSYTFDRLYRLTSETLPGNRVTSYTWDGAGNMASLTDVGGTTTYGYDIAEQLTSLTQPGGFVTTFGYDADGNRTSTVYPSAKSKLTAEYDAGGRLKHITGYQGTTVRTRFEYDYVNPATGNETALRYKVTDYLNATTSYDYDPLGRLTEAITRSSTGTVTNTLRYWYDTNSNRTRTLTNTTNSYAAYNAADQLCWTASSPGGGTCASPPASGVTTYQFDGAGNQTSSSAGQQLVYDAKNHTTSAKAPGGTALALSYTGPTQVTRATAGTTGYTNNLLGVGYATAADGKRTHYIRDPSGALVGQRLPDGKRYYYLFDGLGSVAAMTDKDGKIANRYTYDPYGTTTSTSGSVANIWRFTGAQFDAQTGLYKIGHRYYQPDTGRWTQRDPLGARINPMQPPEAHPYAYVGCNPVNFTDPSGLASLWDQTVAGVQGCALFGPVIALGIATSYAAVGVPVVVGGSLMFLGCVSGAFLNIALENLLSAA